MHMEQELPTLPGHLSSPFVVIGVHVAQSIVFYIVLCTSLFVLLAMVLYILLLNYGFWLSLWYLLVTPLVSSG